MFWSRMYAGFEGSEGAPLRVQCFGYNLFTKNSTSLNRVHFVSGSMNRVHLKSSSSKWVHLESGTWKWVHQKSGSLKSVNWKPCSDQCPLSKAKFAAGRRAADYVAHAILKWRYLIATNLFKSVFLNHNFSCSLSAPLEHTRHFCTCSNCTSYLFKPYRETN
jgi:hypothetical protein